jgi:2-dehydro-3-deoxygluconokinase
MMSSQPYYEIINDNLSQFNGKTAVFTTIGEVMVRETPADMERLERTRKVYISMAGSEYTLAIGLSRLGIPSAYITRVPENPYGMMVRNIARENGVNTDHIAWAPKTDPIGHLLYEMSRSPRKNIAIYQRKFSAASRLGKGMVDWKSALAETKLFHTSGITFGLSTHSGYEINYNYEAFLEGLSVKPSDCRVGLDFNYRSTLWNKEQARDLMAKVISEHVDILITTIEDMAQLYGISCGQYSAKQIVDGDINEIQDDDIRRFAEQVCKMFNVQIVAITIRYPDTFEHHRWESSAVDAQGHFFRSPAVRPIALLDRLGGGDTWNAGFYYGLLTAGFNEEGMRKGVLVGDAASRLKQTLMFDLPIIEKSEVQALLKADVAGGGKRVDR